MPLNQVLLCVFFVTNQDLCLEANTETAQLSLLLSAGGNCSSIRIVLMTYTAADQRSGMLLPAPQISGDARQLSRSRWWTEVLLVGNCFRNATLALHFTFMRRWQTATSGDGESENNYHINSLSYRLFSRPPVPLCSFHICGLGLTLYWALYLLRSCHQRPPHSVYKCFTSV